MKNINIILKKKSLLAPLFVFFTNMVSFVGTRFLQSSDNFHCPLLPIDHKIPFVGWFIYIYVIAFLQWGLTYILLCNEDKERCYRFCTGASVANLLCGIIFLLYPTVMTIRPEITGTGLTNFALKLVFAIDNPGENLFPSIHCLESWLSIRVVCSSKKVPMAVKIINVFLSIAVFASVLFVKQHTLIDIPAGILVAEIGLFIGKITKLDKKLIAVESRILGGCKK